MRARRKYDELHHLVSHILFYEVRKKLNVMCKSSIKALLSSVTQSVQAMCCESPVEGPSDSMESHTARSN